MSDSSIQTLLKDVEYLTRAEKIELIDALTKQLEHQLPEQAEVNLADFFQRSPLVGIDIDLTRQVDIEQSEIEL
jgi:hypothetical protein